MRIESLMTSLLQLLIGFHKESISHMVHELIDLAVITGVLTAFVEVDWDTIVDGLNIEVVIEVVEFEVDDCGVFDVGVVVLRKELS